MDKRNKEYIVSRIISGYIPCYIYNPVVDNYQSLVIGRLDTADSLFVHEAYGNAFRDGELMGLLTHDELIDQLINRELWSLEKERELTEGRSNLDNTKLELYKNHLKRSTTSAQLRLDIRHLKAQISQLEAQKHRYDHMTLEGHAQLVRMRHRVARSLRYLTDKKVFDNDEYCFFPFPIQQAIEVYKEAQLNDADFREIARTEPWRSYWSLARDNPFKYHRMEWTEEQSMVVMWAKLFDNVQENPEFPGDYLLEDDDCFDGWLIEQKNKREAESKQKQADGLLPANEKIRNAGEIFIVVETPEDAARIEDMNSIESKIYKRQKLGSIPQDGSIKEEDMPFVQKQIAMESARQQFMKNSTK